MTASGSSSGGGQSTASVIAVDTGIVRASSNISSASTQTGGSSSVGVSGLLVREIFHLRDCLVMCPPKSSAAQGNDIYNLSYTLTHIHFSRVIIEYKQLVGFHLPHQIIQHVGFHFFVWIHHSHLYIYFCFNTVTPVEKYLFLAPLLHIFKCLHFTLLLTHSGVYFTTGTCFSLVRAENDFTLVVHASSVEERDSWFNEINSCILSMPN